ncbi:MAG: DUF2809 domain-containing protein [Bacillota bacterium]|nr:DUF2809 domain-containing protein [Bacillota bacterium]
MKKDRSRIIYLFLVFIVIILGLGSRKYAGVMPSWVGEYAGDALWALMVFLGIGFIFKTWTTLKTALAAIVFSYIIEISQLYHAPWIDSIRATRLGGLILGFVFLWSDLVCYTIGILIGVILELFILRVFDSTEITGG